MLDFQHALRARLEANPTLFLVGDLPDLLDQVRVELGGFVGADPAGLVFVANATAGVNTVLRSLDFGPGDELVVTDQEYNACHNAIDFVAARSGATVVVVPLPFPITGPDEVVAAIRSRVTPRTRLVLIDHVTSPTALVLPVAELVAELEPAGVAVLIDGAHAPGMIPLELDRLGASYYTGNCHKWMCAPKGSAFLWAREDRREGLVPLTISHGLNDPRPGRSRWHKLFDWTGTADPTAVLSVPKAISVVGAMVPGGWVEVQRRNHELALAGRHALCRGTGIPIPAPDQMIGSMAAIPLPGGVDQPGVIDDPLGYELFEKHRMVVPVFSWGGFRLVRVSAQLYNRGEQYHRLAAILGEIMGRNRPVSSAPCPGISR